MRAEGNDRAARRLVQQVQLGALERYVEHGCTASLRALPAHSRRANHSCASLAVEAADSAARDGLHDFRPGSAMSAAAKSTPARPGVEGVRHVLVVS